MSDYTNTANWFVENDFFVKTVPIMYNQIVGPCGGDLEANFTDNIPPKYFQSVSDTTMQYGQGLKTLFRSSGWGKGVTSGRKVNFSFEQDKLNGHVRF